MQNFDFVNFFATFSSSINEQMWENVVRKKDVNTESGGRKKTQRKPIETRTTKKQKREEMNAVQRRKLQLNQINTMRELQTSNICSGSKVIAWDTTKKN